MIDAVMMHRRYLVATLLLGLVGTSTLVFSSWQRTPPSPCSTKNIALTNSSLQCPAPAIVVGKIAMTVNKTYSAHAITIGDNTGLSPHPDNPPYKLLTDAAATDGPRTSVAATLDGAGGLPYTLAVDKASRAARVLTHVNLVNTSGKPVTTVLSPVMGLQFKKGDILSGDWPAFSRHDNSAPCVYSQGMRRSWSDGSLKHLSVLVRCPGTLAASSTLQVDIAGGGTQPAASARTPTELSAVDIKVVGTGLINLTGTWMATVADGIGSAHVWIDGEAGKGWIVDVDMKQGGMPHGQLLTRFYTLLTTDGVGNLGGVRVLPRVWQPYYNVDTPAKAVRTWSSLALHHSGGSISFQQPFTPSTFIRATSTTITAPSSNYYWGATDSNLVPVVVSSTGTLPAGMSSGAQYYARAANGKTTFALYTYTGGIGPVVTTTDAGTGKHTITPVLVTTHFGSTFGATADARWQYMQGGGSIPSELPLRHQKNLVYLHKTRMIPPVDLSLENRAIDSPMWTSPWSQVATGYLYTGIGTTGDRPDIGIMNGYQVTHLLRQTASNEKLLRAMGFSGANLGYGVRDATSGAPPNVSGGYVTGFGQNVKSTFRWQDGIVQGFTGPPATNTALAYMAMSFDHQPATAWPAYLFTGEPQFLDIAYDIADGALYNDFTDDIHRNPTLPAPGTVGSITTGLPPQERSGAWQTGALIAAAALAPDMSPDGIDYKTYFMGRANESLGWTLITINNTSSYAATNGLFAFRSFVAGVTRLTGNWQRGYVAQAIAMGAAMIENSDALEVLGKFATWYNHVDSVWALWNLYDYFDIVCSDANNTAPITSDLMYAGSHGIKSFSWTAGTPGVFTLTTMGGYTPSNGDKYIFDGEQVGHPTQAPGGLSKNTPYYFVGCSGGPTYTCNLAAGFGGTALEITDSGTPIDSGVLNIVVNGSSTGIGATGTAGVSNILAGARWGMALGVAGFDAVIADAVVRLNANGWNPAVDTKWAFQSRF